MTRILLLGSVAVVLAACTTSTPNPIMCNNPCNQGDISCAGGIVSTCTMVDGCLEFAKTSTCPSGICQDEMTCATAPNCGSFTTCDTCTATMTINCFWCPGSGTCVASEDSSDCASGNTISGANAITECAEVASCAPCTLTALTLCDDTEFQCTCPTSMKPSDTNCTLDNGQEYCCTS
jgi:hypothetical protein